MTSPPPKRIKLESSPSPRLAHAAGDTNHTEEDVEHCSICLQPLADRTIIPTCSHEFCFECLLVWTDQSRRCPLCSQTIGEYLIHHIRSKYDYQKHYLAPLRTSSTPQARLDVRNNARRQVTRRRQHEWGRRRRMEQEEADELERAIEKRKWVYRHGLYAKQVAQAYCVRATAFIRRELRVWVGLDVEFLTTFTLSLMKSIDIRSEPAIRLLAEFLDMVQKQAVPSASTRNISRMNYIPICVLHIVIFPFTIPSSSMMRKKIYLRQLCRCEVGGGDHVRAQSRVAAPSPVRPLGSCAHGPHRDPHLPMSSRLAHRPGILARRGDQYMHRHKIKLPPIDPPSLKAALA
ncbi:hypothetical protein A0H81_06736 [Grifola frondosa]|uniref:RING-type E3 ubiquitin transferase n=1 Tax=Grifola frondosa TaxID=5627 RepID=A0A1C7M7M4_GRIFR|nr:hypothetical protein A0H81_06736 [Grifola frondosa]